MDELTQLGIKYNTDKAYYHHFTEIYNKVFFPLRDKKLNILEIGVANGGSLLMLKEYFKNSHIYCTDIEDKSQFIDNRVSFQIGDQADYNFISNIFNGIVFDIIIEDGGHTLKQQQVTLDSLFLRLTSNGIYILEDLHTSYMYGYQKPNDTTTLTLLENIFRVDPDNNPYELKNIKNIQESIGSCEIFYTNKEASVTSIITRKSTFL